MSISGEAVNMICVLICFSSVKSDGTKSFGILSSGSSARRHW